MLKISLLGNRPGVVSLRLEGRISGPWVTEMRKACEKLLGEDRLVELDLVDVSFADESGLAALTNLRARGVLLANCSPFVDQQLKASS